MKYLRPHHDYMCPLTFCIFVCFFFYVFVDKIDWIFQHKATLKTHELEKPKHAKLSAVPKHADLPEIEDYEHVELEKFEKPEFEKVDKPKKVSILILISSDLFKFLFNIQSQW